jgi:hypothetical protein
MTSEVATTQAMREGAAVAATKHAWTFTTYVPQISDYHITQKE